MKYSILRTDKANDQLYAIIQYIAQDAGSIDIALGYLDEIEGEIKKLQTTPNMGSYPRYATIKKQGYRVLIVRRHLIFYKVNDQRQEVIIYAVIDARREYLNLL